MEMLGSDSMKEEIETLVSESVEEGAETYVLELAEESEKLEGGLGNILVIIK